MNTANKITSIRLILAPILLFVYVLAHHSDILVPTIYTASALCILFLIIELSDIFDGIIARKKMMVSALGKVLDPFADALAHSTYFIILFDRGIIPVWIFTLLIYRDLLQGFIRVRAAYSGIALQARASGKIKTVVQSVCVGLLFFERLMDAFHVRGLFILDGNGAVLYTVAVHWLYVLAPYIILAVSVISIADYIQANPFVLKEE